MFGIFTTDGELVISSWDDWLASATGKGVDEAVGKKLTDLFPEIEARGLADRLRRVLDEGVVEVLAPAFHKYLIPCPPPVENPAFDRMQQRVTIAPLRQDERIVGLMVTIEDVTERRIREKALQEELKAPEEERRLRAVTALREGGETEGLLDVLRDESWRVRRAAVDALAARASRDTIKGLLMFLRRHHRDMGVVNSALQVLALSDHDVVTPLAEFLRDPDNELRLYSALLLGERRDTKAVPALLSALGDTDPNVRYHVIEALGRIGAPEAVEPLLNVIAEGDFFLSFPALEALASIGDRRAAEGIVPLLKDPLLAPAAVETLGRIGEIEAVPNLVDLLNRGEAEAASVARALSTIHDRYRQRYREGDIIPDAVRRSVTAAGAGRLIDALGGAQPEELRFLAVVLGWLEGEAVERAMTRLLGNPAVGGEVVEALARYGGRVTDYVMERLREDDQETRRAAVIALGRIGDPRATGILTEILREDDDLVLVAAGALAKIGDRRAFEALLGLMGHRDVAVRQAVVGALNSIGHPEMAGRMETLLKSPDPLTRESAVRIAGYFGYENCRDLLLEIAAGDGDEQCRALAVEHLPYLDDDRVLGVLASVLASDTPRVRAAAARALANVEGAEAARLLEKALADGDSWVRYFAARSLGRRGVKEATPSLLALAKGDPAGHVRIAAVKALSGTGDGEVSCLLGALAEGEDEDLARAAISGLGAAGDPAARETLYRVLRSTKESRRAEAVRALGRGCDNRSAQALQWIAAADPSPEVRRAALDTLGEAATPEAVRALLGLLQEGGVRQAAVEVLATVGERLLPAVREFLGHPRVEIRLAVVEILERMKRPAATALIVSALDDPAEAVRLAALWALIRLGSRGAEGRLRGLMTSDPSLEVRRLARQALGRMR